MTKLEVYCSLLQYWNERINLTAIRDLEDIHTKHIEDCLSILPILRSLVERRGGAGPVEIADIGSGAGLPGIIIAIAEPDWRVTLVETRINKCRFLMNCVEDVGLPNVHIAKCRAEEFCMPGSPDRGTYDIVTARAVADITRLASITLPAAKLHGKVVAMTGRLGATKLEVEQAQSVISKLGGLVDDVVPLNVPGMTESIANPKFLAEKLRRGTAGSALFRAEHLPSLPLTHRGEGEQLRSAVIISRVISLRERSTSLNVEA